MMRRFEVKLLMLPMLVAGALLTSVENAFSQLDKDDVNVRIESGYKYMLAGNYQKADEEFRFVLDHAPSLPPDICYYFGVNSYHLQRYKQSINWLNKYIELKGTDGRHFDSCEEYLEMAEEAYREENKIYVNKGPYTEEAYNEEKFYEIDDDLNVREIIDCERVGKIICPVCKGKGVIIKEGLFGKEYNTCPYGDDYGYMNCQDYNLLLQGKLEPKVR